jgi:cyclophilin family peptidyl-prolyl cis-trans isomerase
MDFQVAFINGPFQYKLLIIFASVKIRKKFSLIVIQINDTNSKLMKKIALFLLFAGLLVNMSCGTSGNDREIKVQIETEFGIIKIKLYNETPLHRDNFVKLIKEGIYTDQLFHRVINGFMIQGGDPDSKNAKPGEQLGRGDLGYTVPAEINPKFFHRRGILAAARQGDDINPEKRSSASQFYILQGRKYRSGELDTLQMKMEDSRKMSMLQAKIKLAEPELNKLGAEGKQDELMARYNTLKEEVMAEVTQLPTLAFSEEQRLAYTTVGGYPSLDHNYTVFGEVIDGMDVVDNIARQETDRFDRPVKDIKFKITIL